MNKYEEVSRKFHLLSFQDCRVALYIIIHCARDSANGVSMSLHGQLPNLPIQIHRLQRHYDVEESSLWRHTLQQCICM